MAHAKLVNRFLRIYTWIGLILFLMANPLSMNAAGAGGDDPRKGKPTAEKPVAESKEKSEPETEEKKVDEEEKDRFLLITGGDLHPVTGPVMRETDVLVKNGVIHRIGVDLDRPEECELIDAAGMQVYPGLIAAGSGGIVGRAPAEHSTNPFGLDLVLGLAGGLTTVVSDNTAVKLTYGTLDDMILKRNIFTTLRYDRGNPKARQDLRNDLDKVRDYLRELDAYENAKAGGDADAEAPDEKSMKGKLEGYLKLLKGETAAMIVASGSQDILDACDLARDFGFKLVIDRGVEAWVVPGVIGRAGAQVMLTPRSKARPDLRKNKPTGWNIETARILHEHGVNFAVLPERRGISLGGITGRDLLALPMEAAFAVRGGLPEKAALESITIQPARMLGIDKRVGSIEVGKDADLIVCDGDLLHYNTLVQWTVVNGLIAYDKEKETLFAHIRSREGKEQARKLFWPRPFGEMPDYETYDTSGE